QPEVRRYKKHASPTTEVAIWSRLHEDVYAAMRPTLGASFIQLVAVVNPLIIMLWAGTALMFLGGVLLLFPNEIFVRRASRVAEDEEEAEKPPALGAPATARTRVTTTLLVLVGLLVPGVARADGDPHTQKLL